MKITLTVETVEEANGILLALSKFPLDQVGPLYSRLQAQIVEQTKGAAAVLGVKNTPPKKAAKKK